MNLAWGVVVGLVLQPRVGVLGLKWQNEIANITSHKLANKAKRKYPKISSIFFCYLVKKLAKYVSLEMPVRKECRHFRALFFLDIPSTRYILLSPVCAEFPTTWYTASSNCAYECGVYT